MLLIKSKYELISTIAEDILSFQYDAIVHATNESKVNFKNPTINDPAHKRVFKKPNLQNIFQQSRFDNQDAMGYIQKMDADPNKTEVSIWEFKPEFLNPHLIRHLIRLSEQLVNLRHPRLLSLLDYHYDGKSFFLVYEKPEPMVSLEEFLQINPEFTPEKLHQQCKELLSVYRFLHEKKFCCGSINLNGIYVTSLGEFWVGKVAIPIEIFKVNWKSLQVIEDCIFYPPEFILDQIYDHYSDIYSYGVLVYHLLSKQWPFPFTHHIHDLKLNILNPPILNAPMSNRFIDIVLKCLQKNPYDRFSSFSDLLHAYFSEDKIIIPNAFAKMAIQEHIKKEVSETKRKPWIQKLSIIALILFILMALIFCYTRYIHYVTSIPESSVPNVIGMNADEAIALLKKYHLVGQIAAERVDSRLGAGIVLQSKPTAGMSVKQSRIVKLVISKGGIEREVPKLIGRSKQDAQDLLAERHLPVEWEEITSGLPPGTVVNQSPSANQLIKGSESIKLLISRMPRIHVAILRPQDMSISDREISIDYEIFPDMPNQNVEIFSIKNNQKEKIFSVKEIPGQSRHTVVIGSLGGSIEIYFNGALMYQSLIKDNPLDD